MIYNIYVGLNDGVKKKQLIRTRKALKLVSAYLANNTDGATVSLAKGVYKHENGKVVKESTIKIELILIEKEKVLQIVNHFKTLFNQESVLLTETNGNINFI